MTDQEEFKDKDVNKSLFSDFNKIIEKYNKGNYKAKDKKSILRKIKQLEQGIPTKGNNSKLEAMKIELEEIKAELENKETAPEEKESFSDVGSVLTDSKEYQEKDINKDINKKIIENFKDILRIYNQKK